MPEISVRAAQDEAVFVAPALDATLLQFVGPGGGPTTGPGLLGGITGESLSPDSATPYRQTRSLRLLAEAELRHRVRPQMSVLGRLAVGQGSSLYRLPQGAGILTEPIEIGFSTRFASVEAGLVWHKALAPGLGVELGLALGQRFTHTRTTIDSALLAVRNRSRQQDGFVALRGTLHGQPEALNGSRLQLELGVLAYPGRVITTSAGASLQF